MRKVAHQTECYFTYEKWYIIASYNQFIKQMHFINNIDLIRILITE